MTSDSPLYRCCRTVSMETGCQNMQMCVAILKVAFPPEVIGLMFLFPLLYITFQCAEALLLAMCFRCYQTFKPQAQGKCHICVSVFLEWGGVGADRRAAIGLLNSDHRKPNIALLSHRYKNKPVLTLKNEEGKQPWQPHRWQPGAGELNPAYWGCSSSAPSPSQYHLHILHSGLWY